MKKLTAEINRRLKPEFAVQKQQVRDYCRDLDAASDRTSFSTELKPRNDAFAAVVKEAFISYRDNERRYLLNVTRENGYDTASQWAAAVASKLPLHLLHFRLRSPQSMP